MNPLREYITANVPDDVIRTPELDEELSNGKDPNEN